MLTGNASAVALLALALAACSDTPAALPADEGRQFALVRSSTDVPVSIDVPPNSCTMEAVSLSGVLHVEYTDWREDTLGGTGFFLFRPRLTGSSSSGTPYEVRAAHDVIRVGSSAPFGFAFELTFRLISLSSAGEARLSVLVLGFVDHNGNITLSTIRFQQIECVT